MVLVEVFTAVLVVIMANSESVETHVQWRGKWEVEGNKWGRVTKGFG